ncbi:MAG: hypothetical protein EHM12_11140 [Dehalococcoidia bacterium]|nr:MAG: hypothetical protein EHM12_11140 [Dehalococcoidia bacterium]
MPTYKITDPNTGKTVRLTGDSPPTEQELNDVFSKVGEDKQQEPETSQQVSVDSQPKEANWLTRAGFSKESTPENRTLFGLPRDVESVVLPKSSQVFKESQKAGSNIASRHPLGFGLDMVSDIMELPKRALGTLVKNPETGEQYKITESESGVFNPGGKKLQEKIAGSELPGYLKKPAIVATGIASDVASDPLTFLSSPGKLFKKGAEGASMKIEKSLLKPRETELRKVHPKYLETGEKIPALETVTNNIFEYKLGGNVKQSAKKTNNLLNKTENEIKSLVANSDKKFDIYDAIGNVGKDIKNNPDKYFGKPETEEALKFWTTELGKANKIGASESAKTALEAKRLLGKEGWNVGKEKGDTYSLIAREINSQIGDKLKSEIPELQKKFKIQEDLIPVKKITEQATEREGKKDILGIVAALGAGIGQQVTREGGLTPETALAMLAGYGATKIPRSGTVANMLNKTSKINTGITKGIQTADRTLTMPSRVLRQLDTDTEDEKKRKQQQILQQIKGGF